MGPIEISKGIYDVGVTDWNVRDFHGYSTNLGSTYNSFLIVDEKIVLIDTVKHAFGKQLLDNVSQIVDPKKIDIVISNHTEMDHSGSLELMMTHVGMDKPLYCSQMGERNLSSHFGRKWNYHAVGNGEELKLGSKTLMFLETRMLHWPDSMFSYLKEDKILFSSDAFGQHYSGYEKFDDQIDDAIMYHAQKYYANILLPYSALIRKLLAKVGELKLEFDMICPDHGILWRRDPGKILAAYDTWSRQEAGKKVIVLYDTMWHSTEKMAEKIAAGIADTGVMVKLMNARHCHRSDIITETMDAKAVIVGSPTLNNNVFPTLMDVLTYMKGLKPLHKLGAAFGSYGWSGEAVKQLNAQLESMKFELVDPGLKVQYVPDSDNLEACVEFGRKIGNAVIGSLS